jgi:hypothetical protein
MPMSSYLILSQQGVANTREQHHGYKKRDKASGRHSDETAGQRWTGFSS